MMRSLLSLAIFFLAIVIHEYAHGWMAYYLGDPTAKYSGRLTLNPLAHIDLIGTVIFPLILSLMGLPVIGWAKPVPINFSGLHNPKKDILWVGLAGPGANLCLAVILSLGLHSGLLVKNSYLFGFISLFIFYNLMLAIFNLIPLPPIDGSRILFSLLPYPYNYRLLEIEPYGFLILFFLLYIGLLNRLIIPIVIFLANFLGVGL